MSNGSLLVIRLSAMGDIIHTLPAITTLKRSFSDQRIAWLVAPRWMPLLVGNPFIDELIPLDRRNIGHARKTLRRVRALKADIAFDFQGLFQSALVGRLARPKALFGFSKSVAREPFASLLYTQRITVKGPHRVERAVQLAEAAGARQPSFEAWIPPGVAEGNLPDGPFVLTNPFAGWAGKEWPLPSYEALGRLLNKEGIELVVNVGQSRTERLKLLKHVRLHSSSLSGLIDATRRATAVVGLDSGPLHLAAALGKPGVGLYGPTDPALTGPFGGSMTVLRAASVETTYKRHGEIHASMREITPEQVSEVLLHSIRSSVSRGSANAESHVVSRL
ncbi:MAG TPA: glycosyltransferase family 9 protein [Bryobacteraceae bacterium]|nr:glycosyltransferase family 9 protein [Bryobacteraceae bacterium]